MTLEKDWRDDDLPLDEALEKQAARSHPSPEQTLIRAAVEKALTPAQREVWEAWNYDRETQVSIAKRLGISQPCVAKRIVRIERRLKKWCVAHREVYEAISGANDGRQD